MTGGEQRIGVIATALLSYPLPFLLFDHQGRTIHMEVITEEGERRNNHYDKEREG